MAATDQLREFHYLDHAATTAVRSVAVDAMLPLLTESYGNPSGAHRFARQANQVLDESREIVAAALGVAPGGVVFTAGGTEADNLAVLGAIESRGGIAVCSAIEHHAVLDAVEHSGGIVINVDGNGVIDLADLEAKLTAAVSYGQKIAVVSVMLANNETGVIQPLDEVARIARSIVPDLLIHTDAVQAMAWLDLTVHAAAADLISISAHKFGGPKGVGALGIRAGINLAARNLGGGQERGRRGGTQNVPGIAAMAAAVAATVAERDAQVTRVGQLRDRLVDTLLAEIDDTIETGDRSTKTANIAHLCFAGVENEALLFLLEKNGIMASAASSCSSGAMEPSHVLAAMGVDRSLAFGSLRLSLGYPSTEADVDAVLATLPAAIARIRAGSAV